MQHSTISRASFGPALTCRCAIARARKGLPPAQSGVKTRNKSSPARSHYLPDRFKLKQTAEESIRRASDLAGEAEKKAAEGNIPEANNLMRRATESLSEGAGASERLMSERTSMQILAAVGLQMASFVHEINGLLGTVNAIEDASERLRSRRDLNPETRREIASLSAAIGDMRRIVERQASYLTDITSPDARRRPLATEAGRAIRRRCEDCGAGG